MHREREKKTIAVHTFSTVRAHMMCVCWCYCCRWSLACRRFSEIFLFVCCRRSRQSRVWHLCCSSLIAAAAVYVQQREYICVFRYAAVIRNEITCVLCMCIRESMRTKYASENKRELWSFVIHVHNYDFVHILVIHLTVLFDALSKHWLWMECVHCLFKFCLFAVTLFIGDSWFQECSSFIVVAFTTHENRHSVNWICRFVKWYKMYIFAMEFYAVFFFFFTQMKIVRRKHSQYFYF